jgi:hypothetical protein
MTIQSLPVEQIPHLYISGMNLSVASTTVMAIAPGACRDMNDNIDMEYPSQVLINSATTGAGGLDFGVLLASTNYLVFAIADSQNKKPSSAIISLQANVAPLLPFGYDSYRLIGTVSTDGSVHFVTTNLLNANFYKGYFLSPAVSVLSGGNQTTFTAIDLSTPIPTTTDPFVVALCTVTFIPLAVGDTVTFRPTGYTGTTANLPVITGLVAGVAQTQNIMLNCGVGSSKPEVDYKVTVSGDAVSISVYGYYVTLS